MKFRRQYPLGPFVADFYCPEVQLVIELDGNSHLGREDHDARRQRYLESHRILILRFANREILEQLQEVLAKIQHACRLRADG